MPKSRLYYYHRHCVCETLIINRNISSVMELPQPISMVCSASSHSASQTALVKAALENITGQRPKISLAKKSIAAFNLRKGSVVGCVCTIRRQRLYLLLDLLITAIIPKMADDDLPQGVMQLAVLNGNISFGCTHALDFWALEPFFTYFENLKGFNISCTSLPRRG